MEDRLLDLIFSLGGRATIWRSFAERDSLRVVRGLLVQWEPGQDSFSLLISPEGHLTPLFQIKEAEETPSTLELSIEPPTRKRSESAGISGACYLRLQHQEIFSSDEDFPGSAPAR